MPTKASLIPAPPLLRLGWRHGLGLVTGDEVKGSCPGFSGCEPDADDWDHDAIGIFQVALIAPSVGQAACTINVEKRLQRQGCSLTVRPGPNDDFVVQTITFRPQIVPPRLDARCKRRACEFIARIPDIKTALIGVSAGRMRVVARPPLRSCGNTVQMTGATACITGIFATSPIRRSPVGPRIYRK